jgi:uncharacterized repeat protein (TIGR01451 family)
MKKYFPSIMKIQPITKRPPSMKTQIHITKQTAKFTSARTVVGVLTCWLCLVLQAVAGPPATISGQPTNQTVQVGGTATFAVQASGNGFALTYQWYFQAASIFGATNSTYVITNAQPTNAGAYYVAVDNGNGIVNSSNATLIVNVPITVGNSSSAGTNGTTLTWSHTVGSGTNRILIVGVAIHNSARTVSSATYGGQNLNYIGQSVDGGGKIIVNLYELLAPPVGTTNVTIIINAGDHLSGGAVSFTGVSQTTPLGNFASAGGGPVSSGSVNVASATNELVVDIMGTTGDAITLTPGGNQTQRWNISTGSGGADALGASSTQLGAGTVTMSWTLNHPQAWALGAVSLKPFTAPPPPPIIWDGGGVNNNWSSATNWAGNVAPTTNGTANILFAGSTRLAPNVDTSWNILGLTFSNNAGAFTVGGSPLTVQALGINNNSASTETISNKITLGNSATFSSSAGPLILSGNLTNAGYLTTVSGTGNITLSGILSGIGGLTMSGSGTLTLSGSNTFTGTLSINSGTLALGNSNRIADTVNVTLFGGTFASAGFNETAGTCSLSASSMIDLGSGTSMIHFANSSGISWQPGSTLLVSNWSGSLSGGGTEQVYFGNAANGLTATQLAQINFTDVYGIRPAKILSTGEVVPGVTADVVVTASGAANIYATSNLTYTITVTNVGPYAATNVVVSDLLPANSTFVSASGGATNASGVVNWSIAVLAQSATTNFSVTVIAPLTGALTNIVSGTAATADSNASNNDGSSLAAQVVTAIIPVADIVTVQSGATSIAPFTNLTYTVTVSNQGPCTASNVVVFDTLASKFNFVSASAGGTYLAGIVTWPAIVNFSSGATTNFTVTVASPNKGTLTNVASSTSITADLNTTNNDGSAASAQVTTVVSSLKIDNTSSAASVTTLNWSHTISPGSGRILIVGLSIDSPNDAVVAATFANLLPLTPLGQTNGSQSRVVMYYLINPPVGTYPISINLATTAGIVGGALSFNGVDQSSPIAGFAGNTGNGSVANATVTSSLGGVVVDTVAPKSPQKATAPGANQTSAWNQSASNYSGAGSTSPGALVVSPSWSLNGSPAWAMGAVALNPAIALADIILTASGPNTVLATSNLSYTLTVTNLGTDTATNVAVIDVLPAGAVFMSATSGGTNNAGVVSWPILANFVAGTRTNYTVTITASADGSLTNIAYSTAFTADPDPSNNNGTGNNNQLITTITPLADIATTVTGPSAITATLNYSYSILVTNQGPSIASNILVSNMLPPSIVFVNASAGGTVSGGVVAWPAMASLNNGASSNYSVTVTAPASGTLTNIVFSTAASADSNPANNNGTSVAAKVVTVVYPIPVLSGNYIPGLGFQLQFSNPPNTTVSIDTSTNLADWQILVMTNSGSGIIDYIDQNITDYPRRFYRTMQGP